MERDIYSFKLQCFKAVLEAFLKNMNLPCPNKI